MEIYLQFGYGMKQISIDLSEAWNGATSILSPRDISPIQLDKWKASFRRAKISTLFDPQIYYPKSDHEGLKKYAYWDASFSTKLESGSNYEEELTKKIVEYNDIAETVAYIIPSAMLTYDSTWHRRWQRNSQKLIDATKKHVHKKCLLTLALPDVLLQQQESEIDKLLEACESFDVDGYYVIAQPPQEKYLVDVPMWLINVMQLCAGLKLQGKKVVMGYANQQLLCLSATGIDAIATGTYLNVRRFTNKFVKDDSISRKSVWYYYPASLSEYKLGFLDTAYNNGVLDQMRPTKDMDNGYVDILFSGAMPSSTAFNETMAFLHYLHCMHIQAKELSKSTYRSTVSANEVLLETAMRRIEYMEKNGVYAQTRSFKDMVDVNRSALQRVEKNWGFQLNQEWQ